MVITWEGLVALSIGLVAIATAITVLHTKIVRPLNSMLKEWRKFMQDWSGEPGREGRDRVPGVMERLNDIDGELKRNGGKSIKDTVTRIEKRLIEGDKKFDDIYSRLEALESR